MATQEKELMFLILQYLDEEKHKETVHRLETESGCYFNMSYFKELVTQGKWDEMEKYLSGFTKVKDNQHSVKIFFEIRKHKYLEALDKRDHAKAVDILRKDLRMFEPFSKDLFEEMMLLLTLDDFRENPKLSMYKDTETARADLFRVLEDLIKDNPLIRDKLHFPTIKTSRLRTLINQSLNWQHRQCKNPMPIHDIKTLYVDHICMQPSAARAESPAISHPNIAAEVLSPIFSCCHMFSGQQFQPAPGAIIPAAIGAPVWRRRSASSAAILMGPQTPSGHIENQNGDSNNPLKRSRSCRISQEVGNIPPVPYSGQPHGHNTLSPDDLPKVVATTLPDQGSPVTSMDFHPIQQILLLVGTLGGDVFLWNVGARKKIYEKCFDVWKLDACSKELQASLYAGETASVNHVTWCPDGTLFGVAYSKNIVHIYSFCRDNAVISHLEIEAHTGSVNHLGFSYPNEQLFVVTCGDDRLIKVWDAATGAIRFTFEGHEAPVFSVCLHQKENIKFVFSAATDGKVKTWLYDEFGARGTYDAPGHSSIRMAYNSNGTRLFSCGTNNEGESFLVEWDEGEGSIKRTYQGLGQQAAGIVQFDTTKNRFLAAGDESTIKIWDMDNTNLLTIIHADGGLPVIILPNDRVASSYFYYIAANYYLWKNLQASPCVRFNKEGILLAVSTSDNGVKILATYDGFRLPRTAENRSLPLEAPGGGGFGSSSAMADQSTSFAAMKKNEVRTLADGNHRTSNVSGEGSTRWKVTEITEPSQCYSLRLPDNVTDTKVSRLIYTNSGSGVLALASNAEHKLWKWQNSDDGNLDRKATANVHPVLWKPENGIMMMINETSGTNPEEAIPCLALSKNDCYLVSASGGKISVFNTATFKCMAMCMPPPPAATFLAFLPSDSNIIGIGLEDSSIHIYNVITDKLCVWSMAGWEKRSSKCLEAPSGRSMPAVSDTRVQFHQNQIHLLVVTDTHIAIYDAQKLDWLNKKNEVRSLADGKPRRSNVSGEGSTSWKVTEITEPSQCYSLRLPDNVTDTKVSRLTYTNSGSEVLALASNAELKLWKWQNSDDDNLDGKATANANPVSWTPKSGIMMINETSDTNPESAIPCLALSKSDSYIVSASGGEISLFNMVTFKSVTTYIPPPPEATFLELHPSDNNIIGIALKDKSIKIYNLGTSEVKATLKGHRNRITGLAFSLSLDILVSSCADTQLCIWSMAGWEKQSSTYMDKPRGRLMPPVSDTRVQFHQNQIHLLVICEKQIAIYDAQKLDWLSRWFDNTGGITSGAYSGDCQSIFVSFEDGTVYVFTASNLRLRCRINPTAYLPSNPRSSVYPLVIAAHPSEINQFAVGLSNGRVYVVEPSESEGRWGTSPPGST
ncbi:hypothetical protein N665_0870s0017 [Sinapis alba]|nr:hypothetical protein N665_0870s0017 [Sinapis alba]